MNIIAWLEYELAYYDSAVHRFNHYTTRTPPDLLLGSPHTWWAQKCLGPNWHSPKKRRQTINQASPRRVRGWVTAPRSSRKLFLSHSTLMSAPRNPYKTATTDCHRNQDTPGLIRVPTNTADRSVSQPSEAQRLCLCTCWYLSFVPPTRRAWHKAFCKVGPDRAVAQTRPAAPKMPQNLSAFLKKEAPQAWSNKPSPSKED